MPRYFDKPLPRSTRDIFLLDDKYYFYDEDCFGTPIQNFKLPITIDQILASTVDHKKTTHAKTIYDILVDMPKFKTHPIDSYRLKHIFEEFILASGSSQYFTNDEGKILMLAAGFTPTQKGKVNWRWNTSFAEINRVFLGIDKHNRNAKSTLGNVIEKGGCQIFDTFV